MKNSKKKICFALATLTAVSSLAGCGGSGKRAKTDDGKVKLVWWMSGTEQKDSDKVWAKYNEELQKMPGFENYELEFKLFPFSDFGQKFMLAQTSHETIDITSTYNLSYASEARSETFLDITDMMEEHAPDILKEIPGWALDLCKVDNRQYAITNYQQMATAKYGTCLQADEADEYFNFEKFKNAQDSSDILNQAMYDVYEEYLDALKANGKLNLGMYPGTTWGMMKGYEQIAGYTWVIRRTDDKFFPELYMESEAYKTIMKNARNFFQKGYIRADVLSAELAKDTGKPNGYDIWHVQCYKDAEESHKVKYGMDVRVIEPEKDFYIGLSSNAGGNAIIEETAYPEEALKFLNMMYTSKGKDMYRLLVYGIEGEHYTMVEGSDIRINPIGYTGAPGAADAPYGLNKWIVGNSALQFESPNEAEGWNDYVFNDWNPNAKKSELAGFVFDSTGVEAEAKQVATVHAEYLDMLASGSVENYEAKYEECMKKLQDAGVEKVREAYITQIEEFLANK